MSQAVTFQKVIEFVESLSEEEQDVLFDLIQKRRILKRRQEIARNAEKTMEAVRNGTAKRGTAAEIVADIFEDEV
jgi:predicted transcriptional regulator